jgi:phosphoglycolate phosphatase
MAMRPALIFDLDGTLVDTAPDLLGATNAVLRSEGRQEVDPATLRHMVGFGARSLITQAMAATGAPVEDDAQLGVLVERFLVHYRAHIADQSAPFPGVEKTLEALMAEGRHLAVLTNKPQEMAELLLGALKLDRFFPVIYGAGRMSYVKPDARIFHDVVRDLSAERGIMIGDSITDLATARAARAPVILVNYGYTPEPAETLGGDAVTGDFREVPALAHALAERW